MARHFLSWYHPYRAGTPIAARTAGHGHTFPEVQIRYAPIGVLYSRAHLFLSVRRAVAATALRAAGVQVPVLLGGAAIATRERAEILGADAWTGLDGATALAALEQVILEPDAA